MSMKIKITDIKPNPSNPRVIKDDKFKKLVESIKSLPEMAEVRPIVVNKDMIVLGGNMRLKAMKEAGWKEVPVQIVDWLEDKQREFIIKDNVGLGEWEWEMLSKELIFRDPISIAIHVGTLLMISVELTLFSFLLLPISAFVISRVGKSLKRTAKQGQEQLGLLTSSFDESLSGVRIIKSFNALQFMSSVFRALNLRHQKLTTKTIRKRDVSSLLNETIGAGVMMCLVWFGGKQILMGGTEGYVS